MCILMGFLDIFFLEKLMIPEEYKIIIEAAFSKHGKVSEIFLMSKLKINIDEAKRIMKWITLHNDYYQT